MIDKYCILIDERDQRGSLDSIKRKLRTDHGINFLYKQLNPSEAEYQSLNEDTEKPYFDSNKFKETLQGIDFFRKSNLIAIDYNLIENELNGFQVALMVRELGYKINKEIFLYSAGIEKAIETILEEEDFESKKKKISQLVKVNISFHKKNDFEQELITNIRQDPKFNFDIEITNWLHNFGDRSFKGVFPPFETFLLSKIANEIESNTHNSQEFRKYLTEQIISILIEINELE